MIPRESMLVLPISALVSFKVKLNQKYYLDYCNNLADGIRQRENDVCITSTSAKEFLSLKIVILLMDKKEILKHY